MQLAETFRQPLALTDSSSMAEDMKHTPFTLPNLDISVSKSAALFNASLINSSCSCRFACTCDHSNISQHRLSRRYCAFAQCSSDSALTAAESWWPWAPSAQQHRGHLPVWQQRASEDPCSRFHLAYTLYRQYHCSYSGLNF